MTKQSGSVQVSVSLPEPLLQKIEANRQELSRSDYIRRALESAEADHNRSANGAVYTPQDLAEYVAQRVLTYYFSQKGNLQRHCPGKSPLHVIDPACGDGQLLMATLNAELPIKSGFTLAQLFLYGVDIDSKALSSAQRRLAEFSGVRLFHTNGLCPYKLKTDTGWKKLRATAKVPQGFDIAIANPPWGADVTGYKSLLKSSNLSLYSGQYDTSDLFVEASLMTVREGGFIAFIVPDSIFYQERANLRKLLLTKTTIHFIGRFGEKIFKDVNRACAVIICEKKAPRDSHQVDCFRLPVDHRELILAGKKDFHSSEVELCHKVEQSRFSNNRDALFNIDIDLSLEGTFNKINEHHATLGNYLCGSRGVELSKKGAVVQCLTCAQWLPAPSRSEFECTHCKSANTVTDCTREVIIQNTIGRSAKPIIVGEHIARYKLNTDLWIDVSKRGINYKNPSLYEGHKLVVRKTGIGISASIDYAGCMTNQVVYIFKIRHDTGLTLPLELFLAILNSRLAFFLIAMSSGEIEWKSHPYVTQKQILSLPVPDLHQISPTLKKRVSNLANKLRSHLEGETPVPSKLDAQLEKLVADLYGLTEEDYIPIFSSIDKSQELLTVKALKSVTLKDVFGRKGF